MSQTLKLRAGAFIISVLLASHAGATAPAVGDTPQIQFQSADGTAVDLAKLKGKMVVVDFWATWCGPCMAEAAHMVQVNQTYAPKGLQMIGISLDQDKAAMISTAKAKGFTWPQYFDGAGWGNKIAQQFSVSGIPFTMLIGPEGKVLWTGHPSQIDDAMAQAFKEHPPQLVDPKTLATAQSVLAQVNKKLDASDAAGAAKLFATLPAGAKQDKAFAEQQTATHQKLSDLADTRFQAASTLADNKQYPEALAALRALTLFPADLPATTSAQAKLRELSNDPAVKHAVAAADRDAKAESALADAQKLRADKKDFEAYPRFKEIVTNFAGTESATTAGKAVAGYESDTSFMKRYQEGVASSKGKSMLSLARGYRKAGQTEQAKAKYEDVIRQFPNTEVAKTAETEIAQMASE